MYRRTKNLENRGEKSSPRRSCGGLSQYSVRKLQAVRGTSRARNKKDFRGGGKRLHQRRGGGGGIEKEGSLELATR